MSTVCAELVQQHLVPPLLGASVKASLDLPQHGKRNPDLIARRQLLSEFHVATKKIDNTVRIECDPLSRNASYRVLNF